MRNSSIASGLLFVGLSPKTQKPISGFSPSNQSKQEKTEQEYRTKQSPERYKNHLYNILMRLPYNERPKLSHLRDSGEIEQHIDTCTFLFRPEMAGMPKDESGHSTAGVIELIVAKNRFGSLDSIEMSFSGAKSRLSSKHPRISVLPVKANRRGEAPF